MKEEVLHIVTDPGHIVAEAIFEGISFVIEFGIVAVIHSWWVKRHDRKEHHA